MKLYFSFVVKNIDKYIPLHGHDALELVYYLEGKGHSVIGGEKYNIQTNFFSITPVGVGCKFF